ncbi:MAG: hypothetical protein E7395_01550 [Ruminococcaceae bacterium]|nr:hypothetical protein [Oscillospiraceae bacterium]
MDTLPIGNDKSHLRHLTDQFNSMVKTYFVGGFKVYSETDVKLAKHYYNQLIKQLLKLKTTPLPNNTVRDLFEVYKSLKINLNASYLKLSPFVTDFAAKKLETKSIAKFKKITALYEECKNALSQIVPMVDDLSDVHIPLFNTRNVLVGSLRNHEQLSVCVNKGFYHVPASSMPMDADRVEYVAIYQSKNFFGKNSGILYYGKVSSYNLVERRAITEIPKNSDKMYYKFNLEWHRLPNRICSSGGGRFFWSTSLFLLLRARDICELDFTDFDEYLFYSSIYRLATKPPKVEMKCNYKNIVLSIGTGGINVFKNAVSVYHSSLKDYLSNPGYHFRRILSFSSHSN